MSDVSCAQPPRAIMDGAIVKRAGVPIGVMGRADRRTIREPARHRVVAMEPFIKPNSISIIIDVAATLTL